MIIFSHRIERLRKVKLKSQGKQIKFVFLKKAHDPVLLIKLVILKKIRETKEFSTKCLEKFT